MGATELERLPPEIERAAEARRAAAEREEAARRAAADEARREAESRGRRKGVAPPRAAQ